MNADIKFRSRAGANSSFMVYFLIAVSVRNNS
jgi:hypothetical protein